MFYGNFQRLAESHPIITSIMNTNLFLSYLSQAIISLPQDMKTLLRIAEDPAIDDEGRTLAAGALLHTISAANALPQMRGQLAYIDDVLLLRIVIDRIIKKHEEISVTYGQEFPDLFGSLQDDLKATQDYLGPDLSQHLERVADAFPKISYQGHSANACVHDEEHGNWLYDSVYEAFVETIEINEEALSRDLKQLEPIIKQLKQRAEEGKL